MDLAAGERAGRLARLYYDRFVCSSSARTRCDRNRHKAMARIASGNYDAVVVSHKFFELLRYPKATFGRFATVQIAQQEDAMREAQAEKGDQRIVKDHEKAKKRLVDRLNERVGREHKDDGITFNWAWTGSSPMKGARLDSPIFPHFSAVIRST